MQDHTQDDAARDENDPPFGPPTVPTEVHCLHCGQTFESWQMEVRNEGPSDEPAWCCPTAGCGGLGFLFDIWPTDREWRDEYGELVCQECEDEDFEFEGVVDKPILEAYWGRDHQQLLPYRDAPDELKIDFNGDDEHPLVRMFGESARPMITLDDIPF